MKEDTPGWQEEEPTERVYIKYDPKNNLPTHADIIPNQRYKEVKALASSVCVTNMSNHNLTTSQKELLQWNFRLEPIGFQHAQWLIRTGRLKVQENTKLMSNFERSKCSACEFGKVHRQSNKVSTTKNNLMKDQNIKKDHILSGQMVSEYHYITWDPGRP